MSIPSHYHSRQMTAIDCLVCTAYRLGQIQMRAACIAAVKAITPSTSGVMRELVQSRDKTLEALREVQP